VIGSTALIRSLRARVLVTLSAVLLGCLALTLVGLDVVFRRTAEQAMRERLHTQVVALLSAAELRAQRSLELPERLPEARFANPGSGLYARITDAQGTVLWRSPSALGLRIDYPGPLAPGERRFARVASSDEGSVFAFSMGVEWELARGANPRFTVSVAEATGPYREQLAAFRRALLIWLGLALVLVVSAQAATLGWLMRPLRRVEREIREVESGTRSELGGSYPTELAGVTANLNALLRTERARLARYRTSLGNLAHSLKTPLAVMRNALAELDPQPRAVSELGEQLARVDAIVRYQLHRAAMWGGDAILQGPVDVRRAAERVLGSLRKLHTERPLQTEVEVAKGTRFYGEEGDLLEVLGNLLDNAFKWARTRVRVEAAGHGEGRRAGLELRVEDDGPGMPERVARDALQRGVRGDTSAPGHGLGLAVVRDVAELYQGSVRIERSRLGGACILVRFPPR